MSANRRSSGVIAAILAFVMMASALVTLTAITLSVPAAEADDNPPPATALDSHPVILYGNDVVNADEGKNNDHNFGWDRWALAQPGVPAGSGPVAAFLAAGVSAERIQARAQAFAAQTFVTPEEYIVFDYRYTITPQFESTEDPTPFGSDLGTFVANLHDAIATEGPEVYPNGHPLEPEWNLPIDERINVAHNRFKDNPGQWVEAMEWYEKEILEESSFAIEEIKTPYLYQLYMVNNGLDGNKPSVVRLSTERTSDKGGHALVITTKRGNVLRYRLECGYQPFDLPYWTTTPTPTPTPTPSTTTPTPTPAPTPTTPTPTPTPTPSPTPTPTPTPTPDPGKNKGGGGGSRTRLDPKPADAGPQGQTGSTNPDFGGGENQQVDATLTDETPSASTYTPLVPIIDGGSAPGGTYAATNGQTETVIASTADGGTETVTGNVVAGSAGNSLVVTDQKEAGLDDDTNSGDVFLNAPD